jgi:hypothetical protein
MKTRLFLLCLALGLGTSSFVQNPVPASAGTCNIPIKGDVKQNPDAPIQVKSYELTFTSNWFHVAFVNDKETPATAILWEVRAGNGAAFVRDIGTFSPGAIVRHCFERYGLHAGNYVWQEQPRIRVARVKFEDGTQWSIPDAPPWDDDL